MLTVLPVPFSTRGRQLMFLSLAFSCFGEMYDTGPPDDISSCLKQGKA
jgi:hypothetical protein